MPDVVCALRRQAEQQHAGADADLQDAGPWRRRGRRGRGCARRWRRPRPCISASGIGKPGVAAVPAGGVQARPSSLVGVAVGLVPDRAPVLGARHGRVAVLARHDVGDEPGVAGRAVAGDDDVLADVPGSSPMHGLDLAQLDAVAADLDLVVEAAAELELARRAASGHEVAGAVDARAPARRAASTKRSAVSSGRSR